MSAAGSEVAAMPSGGQRAARLRELGDEIDRAAGGKTIAGLCAALRSIARLSTRLYALADAHNLAVAELVESARELGVEEMPPSGPRESSGFIATDRTGIAHGGTALYPVGGTILAALGIAERGRGGEAVTALRALRGPGGGA